MTMETLAVHAGREDLTALGLHALPIDLSTTNPLPNIEKGGDSYEALATGGTPIDGGSNVYARLWNCLLYTSYMVLPDVHGLRPANPTHRRKTYTPGHRRARTPAHPPTPLR